MRIQLPRMSRGKHLFVGVAGTALGLLPLVGFIRNLWFGVILPTDILEMIIDLPSSFMEVLIIPVSALIAIFGVLHLKIALMQ